MSENKFTPGPWQVAGQFPNMTFVASTGKYADCICKCDTGDSENLPHAANARLIASAPDLLEALTLSRRLLGAIDKEIGGFVDTRKEALQTIDAAIVKARK